MRSIGYGAQRAGEGLLPNSHRPLTRLTATRFATLSALRGAREKKTYLTAIGDTLDPVPPWIFSGCIMKANS